MTNVNINEKICPSRDAVDGVAYMALLVVRVRPYIRHFEITGDDGWEGQPRLQRMAWDGPVRRESCYVRRILGRSEGCVQVFI
jgi:hypothetical protein